jgi:hypothetical protein
MLKESYIANFMITILPEQHNKFKNYKKSKNYHYDKKLSAFLITNRPS